MPHPILTLLSQEEKERIHGQSLEILQKVGVKFNSEKAIKILEEAGCEVDKDNLSAKFQPHLIEKALESLPSKFLLAAINPDKDIMCGNGELYFSSVGGPTMIRDPETGARRPSNTEDVIRCARLVEAMDEISEWCPMLLPMELPPLLRAAKTCQISFLNTSKHMMGSPESREELPFFREMVEAAAGGIENLKKRPLFSAIINPVSPLQNSGALVDNLMNMSDFAPPIFMQFLPLSGATAPITLAGTVLQANAEFLGNMALYQLASPGWPIIWASACGSLDMRTGVYVGGPEAMLMGLALIEMGKFYNVPINTFASSSAETQVMTYRTGMESMFGLMNSALSQVDNMWWPADIDRFNTQDLAVTIMGCEAVRQVRRMHKGFSLDDEHLLQETIVNMGFESEYMGDPSTKKFFRQEHQLPDIFPRITHDDWHAAGEPTEESIALARLKEIQDNHEPVQVDPEFEKELDRIYTAAEKDLVK